MTLTHQQEIEIRKRQAKMRYAEITDEQARNAGYDAGINGPNTENCHFRYFSEPRLTRAWEQGKAQGDARRQSATNE